MIIVRVGKFIDNILSYLNKAENGEKLEIVLPSKKKLQVGLKEKYESLNENANQYWVSAIIQNEEDENAWLLSMVPSVSSIEQAMEVINRTKSMHRVLSAWVDTFDISNNKHTVFHECYVNVSGHVNR